MPRFFTGDIADGTVRITGGDARHISSSLRMQKGDIFEVCDSNGFDYICTAEDISPELVVARVIEKRPSASEPTVKISLFQALPKSDKLDQIAQKMVELGVYELTPVLTSRCVSRWDSRDAGKKLERLQRIMLEAAKQSGRGIIPQIHPLCEFKTAVGNMLQSELAIFCYENAGTPLSKILGGAYKTISVMIGSEGGFSPEEAKFAESSGARAASLGPRILRCETAPVCAVSAILYAAGEF